MEALSGVVKISHMLYFQTWVRRFEAGPQHKLINQNSHDVENHGVGWPLASLSMGLWDQKLSLLISSNSTMMGRVK